MAFQKLGNYRMCSVIDMVIQQNKDKRKRGAGMSCEFGGGFMQKNILFLVVITLTQSQETNITE